MNIAVLGDGTLATAVSVNIAGSHDQTSPDDCHLLWCCEDTPIHDGIPDHVSVVNAIDEACSALTRQLVLVSSQLPIGTCARLETRFPHLRIFCVPENIRAAHAIEDFAWQPRIIIGQREPSWIVDTLLRQFTPRLLHMGTESAEMVKHALNGFLAMSCLYAQEIATLAALHGADPNHVARGLLTDPRIGERAYLKPVGDPGPHLMREIATLNALGGGKLIEAMQ